jgi:hypothetical protein
MIANHQPGPEGVSVKNVRCAELRMVQLLEDSALVVEPEVAGQGPDGPVAIPPRFPSAHPYSAGTTVNKVCGKYT